MIYYLQIGLLERLPNWMGRSSDVVLKAGGARERSHLRDRRADQRNAACGSEVG